MPVTNGVPRRYGNGADEAEFAGRVDYVGPQPEFLSGRVPALQTVGLTVTEVRRGDLRPGQSLEVEVIVVAGSPSVAMGDGGLPALDPSLIRVGGSLTARAEAAGGRWIASEVRSEGASPDGNAYGGRGAPHGG